MRNATLKKFKTALISGMILFIFLTISSSLTISAAQSRLADGAGLLTDTEYSSILSDLNRVSNEYNCDVVIITEDNPEIYNIQDRADLLLESYGLNGILLYVNMAARDWAFSTYGESIPVFSDRRLDVMENNLLGRLSQDDYAGAFNSFISDSENYLSLGSDAGSSDVGIRTSTDGDKMSIPGKIFLSLVIGLVIALIIDLVWMAKLKPVKLAYNANNYAHNMNITKGNERFIRSSVTKTRIEQSNNGGGGSTTHRSSSGGTHGGRSGKF